jgi:Calcineurin-like phosphoesterase
MDRRKFLKISATSFGIGALYQVLPTAVDAQSHEFLNFLGKQNGERPTPFSFVQLSDTHVGFNGPPDPLGTKAFEHAVDMVNALPQKPDLVLVTGDLVHDSEKTDEQVQRMKLFREISSRLQAPTLRLVPGEHDAGLDGGQLFRENFGETSYSFDHRGVHFVALDNVSRARPEVGAERIEWLKKDLSRFPKTAPIVVMTHRPLFDLKPEWEWFTSDGDEVMNVLAPYENVTVLYGHIHRDHEHDDGHAKHYAARSLIFAFPDPEQTPVDQKKPIPFDKNSPFKNLGIRVVNETPGKKAQPASLAINDVELSLREFNGVVGVQQLLKDGDM